LLLILKGPAQTDKREQDEEEDLEEVRAMWQGRVDRPGDIAAQQKRE
jgi:hypothetical protein